MLMSLWRGQFYGPVVGMHGIHGIQGGFTGCHELGPMQRLPGPPKVLPEMIALHPKADVLWAIMLRTLKFQVLEKTLKFSTVLST